MFPLIKNTLTQKNGSVAVLLMCIMGSFILITGILIAASVSASGKSYSDATLQLSGKSILSEYDRKLLDEYGLICFRGDEKDMEKKLMYYANGSFKSENHEYLGLSSTTKKVKLLKLSIDDVEVNLKDYSMINVDTYEDQIKEALKTKLFDTVTRTMNDKETNRTLRNEIVIGSLPSSGYEGSSFPKLDDIANIPDWNDVAGATGGKFSANEYIMKVFKHANKGNLDKETFFNNEVEYILEGKHSDDANYSDVKTKLYAMRFALNGIHILGSHTKMSEVKSIAAVSAAAGVPPPAAEAALIAAWTAAETENDIDLLEKGENVALIKTDANWALTDLQKIADGIKREEGVLPKSTNGQSYGDYLKIFLYLHDRETMLLRMMDLTQINMKGTYYRDFLFKEYFAGYRFNTSIRGDRFNYVQQY